MGRSVGTRYGPKVSLSQKFGKKAQCVQAHECRVPGRNYEYLARSRSVLSVDPSGMVP